MSQNCVLICCWCYGLGFVLNFCFLVILLTFRFCFVFVFALCVPLCSPVLIRFTSRCQPGLHPQSVRVYTVLPCPQSLLKRLLWFSAVEPVLLLCAYLVVFLFSFLFFFVMPHPLALSMFSLFATNQIKGLHFVIFACPSIAFGTLTPHNLKLSG